LSERWGSKDLSVIAGALTQATSKVRIASGITHFRVRHPVILASTAMTMQAMSGGRFMLGVGRSMGPFWKALGLGPMTNQVLIDSADIVRRLCRGEKVRYDGPAGTFPVMRLNDVPPFEPPPIILAAIGPKSLELGGTHFDGVITHPFLTAEAVGRSAAAVRLAAEKAGRDPASVKVYATVVIAPDLPEAEEAAVVGGRAVTYLQIANLGESLVNVNGWDLADLHKLREAPMLAGLRGAADSVFRRHELVEVSRLLPVDWLETGAAVGSASTCAARAKEYLDAGADELVLHGSTPELLGPVVQHVVDNGVPSAK
jgi:probable F420-dependent oxidoreductase